MMPRVVNTLVLFETTVLARAPLKNKHFRYGLRNRRTVFKPEPEPWFENGLPIETERMLQCHVCGSVSMLTPDSLLCSCNI